MQATLPINLSAPNHISADHPGSNPTRNQAYCALRVFASVKNSCASIKASHKFIDLFD